MVIIVLLTFIQVILKAQNLRTDSLKHSLENEPADSNRVKTLLRISEAYYFSKPDSGLIYAKKAIELSDAVDYYRGRLNGRNNAGEMYRFMGNYPAALKMQKEALAISRDFRDRDRIGSSLGFIGFTYVEFGEYRVGLQSLQQALIIAQEEKQQVMETFVTSNIGNAYDQLKMPDSALYYQKLSAIKYEGLTHGPLKSLYLTRTGNAFRQLGQNDSALFYYQTALKHANRSNDRVNNCKIQRMIAELYEHSGNMDSSMYYARLAFSNSNQSAQLPEVMESSNLLARLFQKLEKFDSASSYQDVAKTMSATIYGPQKFRELQKMMLDEQQQQQDIVEQQQAFKNRIKYIALLSALAVFSLLAFVLFRNNRMKQKANILLEEKNKKIEQTLSELKSTQAQLIQSEKMASLGELTAGIAHEIQNPLNFVNNFSEVNSELLDEMKSELRAGNIDHAISIADGITDNEEKIKVHGKRAEGIVRSMLQHSSSRKGMVEETDINSLVDEYLKIETAGFASKYPETEVNVHTEYDPDSGNIKVIQKDIGRVIVNVMDNAFHALSLQQKIKGAGYKPKISVATSRTNHAIEITIKDNGVGIAEDIKEKIFQPFFTTRPTGEGTGLGLSLAYDIVKAHGGEIAVKSKEGEGTEFVLTFNI